jgi:flagellar motility protein MotE (MotC chaperone)
LNPSDSEVMHGESVEGELERFTLRRQAERQGQEGERPREMPWMPGSRARAKDRETTRLHDELQHARGMLESHTRTFEAFSKRYTKRIAHLEDTLGASKAS